jgi:hypothetical protein
MVRACSRKENRRIGSAPPWSVMGYKKRALSILIIWEYFLDWSVKYLCNNGFSGGIEAAFLLNPVPQILGGFIRQVTQQASGSELVERHPPFGGELLNLGSRVSH